MRFTDKAVTCGTDKKGDLQVTLELAGSGREIEIHSKFEKKYGNAIREDILAMLDTYAIKDVKVQADDLGALDFTVKARVETAIRRVLAREGK